MNEELSNKKSDQIRGAVRKNYAEVAVSDRAGCGCASKSCCGASSQATAEDISMVMGYSDEEVSAVPGGANMGLGCGNPQAIASLKPGETVLDLGSGGGFDCFLAARAVGEKGRVIGVDMTPEMISKSRENADKSSFENVDFRLGEMENLPVADGIVDVIISNCVINLSPEKAKVLGESFRVLKPGGRLAISDVVATTQLSDEIKNDPAFYSGCVAGASSIQTLELILRQIGFKDIRITPKPESRSFIRDWMPGSNIEDYVVSAEITAVKP
ncbi:MAG: arsenite methyltransferase [Desulfonatronovibrio sp.]|nr:arsenite methyltransferase [Desulfovibrionales bacterium]